MIEQQTLYHDTYFYIESGYVWGQGHMAAQSEVFKDEVRHIFEADGWTVQAGDKGSAMTAEKDKQSLYLHPMHFSGPVLDSQVEHIRRLLNKAKTFQLRYVSQFQPMYDWTLEEYKAYLQKQQEEISNALLTAFQTKRKNLYISNHADVIYNVSRRFQLNIINEQRNELAWSYTSEVFNWLVESGQIIAAKTRRGDGYRTAKPEERTAGLID